MSFFDSLSKSKTLTLLAGAAIRAEQGADRKWQLGVGLKGKSDYYVPLAVHYGSQVLARFPKSEAQGYERASGLERMINLIVNEGIWHSCNLIRYADAEGAMVLVPVERITRPEELGVALILQPELAEPTLVFDEPVPLTDEALVYSVIALWQAVVNVLDSEGVENLDRVLRYFNSYLDEGITPSDAVSAQHLASRALREAGLT
ncbi:MAG: hypothetical protein ABIK22_02095 [candidate division WOR-3 bacterium]